MHRYIEMKDARQRQGRVVLWAPRTPSSWSWKGPAREPVKSERLITTPEGYTEEALLARFGSKRALAEALVGGDPEIDTELVGRRLGDVDRVWVRPDQTMLYSAKTLEVITGPDGQEREQRDFLDVEATVGDGHPLPWSGRLMPTREVVRRYALGRKVQVRHTDRMTFEFLRDMAHELAEADQMLLVGSGERGLDPLILTRNGSPYRGFLEGRVREDGAFILILHLSNLELKGVPS